MGEGLGMHFPSFIFSPLEEEKVSSCLGATCAAEDAEEVLCK